jgi:hypothetical protein
MADCRNTGDGEIEVSFQGIADELRLSAESLHAEQVFGLFRRESPKVSYLRATFSLIWRQRTVGYTGLNI